jgi:hypothetical protein
VLTDAVSASFARRDFVLRVANKDGGAHVEATLPTAYAGLSRENSMGLGQAPPSEPNSAGLSFRIEGTTRVPDPDATPPANNIALASVPQIAVELVASLEAAVVDDGATINLSKEIWPIPWRTPRTSGATTSAPAVAAGSSSAASGGANRAGRSGSRASDWFGHVNGLAAGQDAGQTVSRRRVDAGRGGSANPLQKRNPALRSGGF